MSCPRIAFAIRYQPSAISPWLRSSQQHQIFIINA
jgi:hypothetical protein